MLKQHQEKDHSRHSIRRYVNGLYDLMVDWSVVDRRKYLKFCETAKLKSNGKYCLAFHPSQTIRDFQQLGGVNLKDLKEHTNAIGGAWGNDTWAFMVKDDADDFEDGKENLEDTKSKRALLIPTSVLTSSQIIKLCDALGQNDDYRRFGADEETPSGVEEVRNSTGIPGSQPLELHESVIPTEDEIAFETLAPPRDSFLSESHEKDSFVVEDGNVQVVDDTRNSNNEAAAARKISEIKKQNKTYLICNCGFSSTSKSAVSRHKCRMGPDESVSFSCTVCDKTCKNPGSLKRHMNSKHKDSTVTTTLEASDVVESNTDSQIVGTLSASEALDSRTEFRCNLCGKKLKNEKNLGKHVEKVHGGVGSVELPPAVPDVLTVPIEPPAVGPETVLDEELPNLGCEECGKPFKSERNLRTHVEKMHSARNVVRRRSLSLLRHKGRRK